MNRWALRQLLGYHLNLLSMELPVQIQPKIARLQRALTGKHLVSGAHPLDVLVALLSRRSKMFSRGWGDEDFLANLWGTVSHADSPSSIAINWNSSSKHGRNSRRDGTFASPLASLPNESNAVHVRAWSREGNRAACVMLAGSHDEGYLVREHVFGSLVARGLDLYLLGKSFLWTPPHSRRTGLYHGQRSGADGARHGVGSASTAHPPARSVRKTCSCRLQHGWTHGCYHGSGFTVSGGLRSAGHRRFRQQHLYSRTHVVGCRLRWTRRRTGAAREQRKNVSTASSTLPISPIMARRCEPTPLLSPAAPVMAMSYAVRPSACIATGPEVPCAGFLPATSPH